MNARAATDPTALTQSEPVSYPEPGATAAPAPAAASAPQSAPAPEPEGPKGVRGRLAAYREETSGDLTTVLPKTGVEVSYPAFIPHEKIMLASKATGKAKSKMLSVAASMLCTFEGEKLTDAEIRRFLPNADVVHLSGLLFGKDEDGDEGEDGEGN